MNKNEIINTLRIYLTRMNDSTQPHFDIYSFVDSVSDLVESEEENEKQSNELVDTILDLGPKFLS